MKQKSILKRVLVLGITTVMTACSVASCWAPITALAENDGLGHQINFEIDSENLYVLDGTEAAAADVADATLVKTENVTTAEVDSYYTVVDAETGEKVTDVNGNEIKIHTDEAPVITEVTAYDATPKYNEDGTLNETTEKNYVEVTQRDEVVYGYFENGKFVETTADAEGAKAYLKEVGDGAPVYKETIEAWKVQAVDGEAIVEDEVKEVLTTGEATDNYERETDFYAKVGDEKISTDDLAEGSYVIGEDGDSVEIKVTEVKSTEVPVESVTGHVAIPHDIRVPGVRGDYGFDNDYEIKTEGFKKDLVMDLDKSSPYYQCYYYVVREATVYAVVGGVKIPVKIKNAKIYVDTEDLDLGPVNHYGAKLPGATLKTTKTGAPGYYYIEVVKKDEQGNVVTDENGNAVYDQKVVDPDNVFGKVEYTVYTLDEEGNKETAVITVDKTALGNIQKMNFTPVDDLYKIEGDEGRIYYLTPGEYEVLKMHDITFETTVTYYYVSNPVYKNSSVVITIDGVEYLVKTSFLCSELVYVDDDYEVSYNVITNEDGTKTVSVIIPYNYREVTPVYDEEGTFTGFTVSEDVQSASHVTDLAMADFGRSNIATLTVSYAPEVTHIEDVVLDTDVEYTDPVTVVNENPVGSDKDSKGNKQYITHVDVVVDSKPADYTISNVQIKQGNNVLTNPGYKYDANDKRDEYQFGHEGSMNSYPCGNLRLDPKKPLTITMTVTFKEKVEGVEKTYTFDYEVSTVWFTDKGRNKCSQASNGGFDFEMKEKEIKEAIKAFKEAQSKVEPTAVETITIEAEDDFDLGDPDEVKGVEELTAQLYVNITDKGVNVANDMDGVELAAASKVTVYLLYNSEGYSVSRTVAEDGTVTVNSAKPGEYATAQEAIEAYLADSDILKAIGNNYMMSVQDTLTSLIAAAARKSVDDQKAALSEGLAANEKMEWDGVYTYVYDAETGTYDYSEAMQDAIQAAFDSAYVDWYMLEDANGTYVISGMVNVPATTFEIKGTKVTIPPVNYGGRVLGATRMPAALPSDPGEVLGAARSPKTSDRSKNMLWMLMMSGSALGAVAALALRKRNEEA